VHVVDTLQRAQEKLDEPAVDALLGEVADGCYLY